MSRLSSGGLANGSAGRTKEAGAPVWGSIVSPNFFMQQTVKIAEKYSEYNWIADGPEIRKNLFASEIARIKARDSATSEKLAAICDAAIGFLKHEEIGFMLHKASIPLSFAVVSSKAGSCKALVNTHVELRDENSSRAWEYKLKLDGYRESIKQLLRKPEYKNNELLEYLVMVIDKQPKFIGKPPVVMA